MSKIRLYLLAVVVAVAMMTVGRPVPAEVTAAGITATFSKGQDWGTGYEGKYTISNKSQAAITSWTVEFDLPAGHKVSSLWDGSYTASGQHVTVKNTWNGNVGPGGTASFGFNITYSGAYSAPTGCRINGDSCDGGPSNPGAPGTPGAPTVTGSTSSSISLSWGASSGTVTGYRVYEGSTVRATVTGTSATISGLGTCESHTYVVAAYNSVGESNRSSEVAASTTGCTTGGGRGAPYMYLGWGDPPSPSTVMNATGVKWFTMAFILSSGGCNAAWDGQRPLQGGADANAIAQIRSAGGDIVPSFGGWQGNKLGPNCSTAQDLAGAYQSVISAYNLKAIDIDIENTDEFENTTVQDRILGALKIIKQNNPGIQTIVTFGTTTTGPNFYGNRLIDQAKALGANIDVFTIMPFDFGSSNIGTDTVQAAEGLKNKLKSTFGWSDSVAYSHMGISGMNGVSDQQEMTTLQTWTQIRDWAKSHGLARLAFWSVNRDRGCAGGGVKENCSGIAQPDWEFSKITAGF